MTAKEVLGKVLEAGGKVIPDPARPRLVVPSHLKPLVAEHREGIRELVLRGFPFCESPACKGCYTVAPGVSIHPPTPGPDWQNWLERWSPSGRVQ